MAACESCGIRLGSDCLHVDGNPYCCAGCASGGPCICTYEHDLGRYPPTHYARPVSLADLLDRYEEGIQTSTKPANPRLQPAPEDLF